MVTSINVKEIERVVNSDLWNRFVSQRKELLCAKSSDLNLLKELGLEGRALEQRRIGIQNFVQNPRVAEVEYSDNVALLYHCSKGNIQDILEQGLDERLGGAGALLGRGIYFSDDPCKSITYDSNDGQLMIFAVYLGDCLSVLHTTNLDPFSLVREPRKESLQQRSRSDLFFDSIVGRPLHGNEFVIYNRSQCCPLYIISYRRKRHDLYTRVPVNQQRASPSNSSISDDKFAPSRSTFPPIAWNSTEGVASTSESESPTEWPFFANNIFKQMVSSEEAKVKVKVMVSSESGSSIGPPSPQPSTSRSALATQRQRKREDQNQEFIKKRKVLTKMDEEYSICCETPEFDYWHNLTCCCNAKLCIDCYSKLAKKGNTMSGVAEEWFKCPFCQVCTGIEIGTCPDGQMRTSVIQFACEGYEEISKESISIEYLISDGGRRNVFRTAYLPNVPEGQRVSNLLGVAWDRRLCFSIGTSATTGLTDTVVWNIHHKTNLNGGVQVYGYPDPTYFDRVLAELKQYGIE